MTRLRDAGLADLLVQTRYLLLDFDGPVCAMFAGLTAREVVLELLDVVDADTTPVPDRVASASDPFDVLRYAATIDAELARRVEAALRSAEMRATEGARPTPDTPELVQAWRNTGRPLSIVSNNSTAAVGRYLAIYEIDVDLVVGRTSADPSLLKPSPHLVTQALEAFGAEPASCTFVGDSVDDVLAGSRVGVRNIGYANKPGKDQALARAGADLVVSGMDALAAAVAQAST
jgi:phosphoglycolate phosphatase